MGNWQLGLSWGVGSILWLFLSFLVFSWSFLGLFFSFSFLLKQRKSIRKLYEKHKKSRRKDQEKKSAAPPLNAPAILKQLQHEPNPQGARQASAPATGREWQGGGPRRRLPQLPPVHLLQPGAAPRISRSTSAAAAAGASSAAWPRAPPSAPQAGQHEHRRGGSRRRRFGRAQNLASHCTLWTAQLVR